MGRHLPRRGEPHLAGEPDRRPLGRHPSALAPVAARLAAGADLATLGPAFEPSTLVALTIPEPTVEQGKIECEVLDLNRFGNVLLNVRELGLGPGSARRDLRGRRMRRLGASSSTRAGWLSVVRGNPANAAEGLGSVAPVIPSG